MHKIKVTLLALACCAGLTTAANAHLIFDSSFDVKPDNPANTLQFVQERYDLLALFNCIERVAGGQNFTGDGFTITFNSDKSATITWTNLADDFFGVYVKGGSNGGNFYTVTPDELTNGTSTVFASLNSNSRPAGISHLDLFCLPGGTTNVPDNGTTAILLGGALVAVGTMRRYVS